MLASCSHLERSRRISSAAIITKTVHETAPTLTFENSTPDRPDLPPSSFATHPGSRRGPSIITSNIQTKFEDPLRGRTSSRRKRSSPRSSIRAATPLLSRPLTAKNPDPSSDHPSTYPTTPTSHPIGGGGTPGDLPHPNPLPSVHENRYLLKKRSGGTQVAP